MTDAAEAQDDNQTTEAEESTEGSVDVVEAPTAYGVAVTESRGQQVLHPTRDEYLELIETLRTEGFGVCLDVCGVDYLTHPGRDDLPASIEPERFEVVTTLINHNLHERIRVRVQVPADDPVVPSLFDLHPGTEAMEREAFDMFGVVFEGHPDPTRILMPEDWTGHPLRKDFAVGAVPVQFKAAPGPR